MLTTREIINQHPNLYKSGVILFISQMIFSLIINFLIYLLHDVLNILPGFFVDGASYTLIGTLAGSYWFGEWTEKRYPGFLNRNTYKISLLAVIYSLIISACFFILLLIFGDKRIDHYGILFFSFWVCVIMIPTYFAMVYCIKSGARKIKQKYKYGCTH